MRADILETLREPFLDNGHDMTAVLVILVLVAIRGKFTLRYKKIDVCLYSVDVTSLLIRPYVQVTLALLDVPVHKCA